jgi:hypothetical protein
MLKVLSSHELNAGWTVPFRKICRNIDNFATSEVYKNGTKPSTVSQARKPVFFSLLKETRF